MRNRILAGTAFVAAAMAFAAAPEPQEGAKARGFTDAQLEARFHYDLGPAEVDISTYPAEQQAGYAVFQRTCSQCHTLARPLNAPYAAKKDWDRYVRRMHLKADASGGAAIPWRSARAIVDFLVYDAKVRKVERKKDFEAADLALRRLYDEVKKARVRREREKGEEGVQRAAPYTGAKP